MENSLKALLLAASISITCMVISLGFYTARQAKTISAITTEKLNNISSWLQEEEYTRYDGILLMGSDVVNFIEKHLSSYSHGEIAPIYVYVQNGWSEKTYVNRRDIEKIKDYSNKLYINPLAKYKGYVVRDHNDVILGVSFTRN